jgi:hypothetical protein
MKKIKLTVASILLSGICFAQNPSGGHDYCQREYTMVPLFEGNRIISELDYLEAVNTVEDLIEWITWDIKSDDIKPAIGVGYLENLDAILVQLKAYNTEE